MCSKTGEGDDDKIEALIPPKGSEPGDLISIGDFERSPVPEINPKKSQWDLVSKLVKTNSDGVAVFDQVHVWKTQKGEVTSTLINAIIS